ncbi:hypothetical protein RUM44_012743 [Polyplax serrata]|uniref:Polycomb-like MTF2 factor 2 C-terminal domain-containing protein n=1 Tax=Polyplax serrata TaxID=468196 RepID=A0ABR1BE32_POLSC
MEIEKQSEPDSTTLEKDVRQQFRKDEDVLCLNSKDGCFYLGTIVQVDSSYKKCLVEFLDNTKVWSSFKDLKSFAPQEPDVCYICKKSQLKDENNIIICKCERECQQDNHEVNSSTEYYGRGLVKRSTPFPSSEQGNTLDTRFRSHAVRKARRLLNKNLKRQKKTAEHTTILRSSANFESQEGRGTRISHNNSPPTFEHFVRLRKRKMNVHGEQRNQEIRKRPQRNLLEARLNSTESKLCNPFTSVDNSESRRSRTVVHDNKKHDNSSSRKSRSSRGKTGSEKTGKSGRPNLVQKTIYDSFNIKNTDKQKYEMMNLVPKCKVKESDQTSGDSKSNSVKSGKGRRSCRSESLDRTPVGSDLVDSSDDEVSSRGTLEPFIPTPKDFEGHNNPFRSVNDSANVPSCAATATIPPITLPIPLKTVIPHNDPPRLKKRQLSEEDIIIDRNGQVKRRRRHRKNVMAPGTAAKSAQITPGKNKKHWCLRNEKKTLQPLVQNNGSDFALNGRQLRARDPIKLEKAVPQANSSPLKHSPTKDGGPLTDDLESSVKYFFGAASRILNGEKYEIRAKRVTFDGRLQCIIDWKGLPT